MEEREFFNILVGDFEWIEVMKYKIIEQACLYHSINTC